jgi:PKD repeat protein
VTRRSLALAAWTLGSLLSSGLLAQPTSHQQNPTVVFPGPGTYDVTLTVCNADGCSQKTKSITVLDPVPRLTSALAQPTPVPIGQIVTLSAKATGKPPIAFHWTITSPSGGVTLLTGNPASWPTAHLAPGAYSVDLRADSPSGSATAHAGTVVLVPDAPASFWRLSRPCRLLDTRSTTPLLSTDPPRVFSVTSNAACPIPAKAVAIAANVTAVNPTAPGYFVLFPGNYAVPPTSTVSLDPRHPTRTSFAVLPVSTDGRGTLAASYGSPGPASAHLVLDVSGYFAPTSVPAPVAIRFDSPLCPVFCIFPAGIPLALHYQIVGLPNVYRYDWTGSGPFSLSSSTPLASFTFTTPGYYAPRLQVAAGSSAPSTVSFTPAILATTPIPSAAPPAPSGVRASFLGILPADPLDPRESLSVASFAVSVARPPGATLLGWNVFFSLDGAPLSLQTTLPPDLPASTPLRLPLWDPAHHSARIALAAINYAAQGPLSPALTLVVPASTLRRIQKLLRNGTPATAQQGTQGSKGK